jgi:hypothetical protein
MICACCGFRSFEISTGMVQCSACAAAYVIPEMDDLRIQLIRDTIPQSIIKTYNGYQGVQSGYIFTVNLADKSICLKVAGWKNAKDCFDNISELIDKEIVQAKT